MQSFRTELENPLVEKDIIELEKKIRLFREGRIDPEKFRTLRLARGVYGQRQQGVQMIRIKIPFGKISVPQLLRIADVADEYSNGNLHLTTRQDVQIHFVSLDKTPELWAKLEEDDITLREACGNTVRNITASAEAGIDSDEPFDVSPYAQAMFAYFLRKPFCQELGRKIKIAFSSSVKDTAFTFIHDLGFIPVLKTENGKQTRGFKIVIAGGLGAQPILAQTAFEFLEDDKIIPFTEGVLRVFDRYGERTNRHKARLKYLVSKLGLQEFLRLVDEEKNAVIHNSYQIDFTEAENPIVKPAIVALPSHLESEYERWLKTNVFEQKGGGFAAYVRIQLGNISSTLTRIFAEVVKTYASVDDIRITNTQNFLLKHIHPDNLPGLFQALHVIGLANPGYNSAGDITACPGTDTCNLAISSSTGISKELERVISEEFPDLIYEQNIKIKISGCMNACGQHGLAQIGFHGSSFKAGVNVVPALQLLLGGGVLGNGNGRVADKIIKVPSKRGPALLRDILNDYAWNANEGEYFNDYYDRMGKDYFYQLLKPHADISALLPGDFMDWEQEEKFQTAIGIGECAGVAIDLVQTLFFEAEEKLQISAESLLAGAYADALYQSYSASVQAAKALLSSREISSNTQMGIINAFNAHFIESGIIKSIHDFKNFVLQINIQKPEKVFAENYYKTAEQFVNEVISFRRKEIEHEVRLIQPKVKFDL